MGSDSIKTFLAMSLPLFFAASVAAQAIQEWKTPDGQSFFGEHPPTGSVPVKNIDNPVDTLSAPPIPPSASRKVTKRAYVWRDGVAWRHSWRPPLETIIENRGVSTAPNAIGLHLFRE
jgi:hypothetical protein